MGAITDEKISCTHCGEQCTTDGIRIGEKIFCCEGCKMVYRLLDRSGLCDYYQLNERPGTSQRTAARKDKFSFLEDAKIAAGLIAFRNEEETHAGFYLPQIHCSSCLYLLENLHRLDPGVISSRVDFAAKEITVIFDHRKISLRQLAELLTSVGYEPYISLHDLGPVRPAGQPNMIYRLGIAGFCFANIMLLSFPEYLGLGVSESGLQKVFRSFNLFLSLPVFLYSAQPFYRSAWKGLRHRFLNIDAPIVLAILVTFARSLYEVLSGTGAGYFDSMTGIVFFMLAGRVLQDRTYRQLSFERDYTSYFPIAVTVVEQDKASGETKAITRALPEIRCGDTLRIHHEELIPADGILTRGKALIDYSFVTGESLPVWKEMGEIVYAGGRQTGTAIELLVVKEVAQSYLTRLWNRQAKDPQDKGVDRQGNGEERQDKEKDPAAGAQFSFVTLISRYFTFIVLGIAAGAACYWGIHDPGKTGNAVTAVLIIACPCALLLSSTFTNGNILRILGRNQFYLRNAQVIGQIAGTTHIVFDKTGTLTWSGQQEPVYEGTPLTKEEQRSIATLAAQSTHPLSRALARHLDSRDPCSLLAFREVPGKGLEGYVDGVPVAIGTRSFVTGDPRESGGLGATEGVRETGGLREMEDSRESGKPGTVGSGIAGSRVYIARDHILLGFYSFANHYREGIAEMIGRLRPGTPLSVLSGDNAWERPRLEKLLGGEATLLFGRRPIQKSRYIRRLQKTGEKVMMIGDGLNDAGALQQSDIGIALSENGNHFTPASDAILHSGELIRLPAFIRLCRAGRRIILASFALSLLYNIIGLSFAVQGNLSPLVAAILMPASSLSILLITYGSSNIIAGRLGL